MKAIILGGTGLVGSALTLRLQSNGLNVSSVNTSNYSSAVGMEADVLINCNGNSYRYKANENPRVDFDANVLSVEKSIFDFRASHYIHISTVDVYSCLFDIQMNKENSPIDTSLLDTYGFHKWMSERLVEKFCPQYNILRLSSVLGPNLKKGPVFDFLNGKELFMAPDSELSFIDTDSICTVVEGLIKMPQKNSIINVAGTGFVTPAKLSSEVKIPLKISNRSGLKQHRYNINVEMLSSQHSVKSSEEIALNFMRRCLKEQG